MLKNIIYFSLALLLCTACGTIENSIKDSLNSTINGSTNNSKKKSNQKNVTEISQEKVEFPEVEKFGIKFSEVENFKNFAVIYLPYSGKGFRKNQDVDIDRNRTDSDIFLPGVIYKGQHFSKMSSISSLRGNLDEQYEKYKKKFMPIPERYKEFSEEQFTKTTIGDYEVGNISIRVKMKVDSKQIIWTYGYLIMHNNKAALFEVSELQVSLEEMEIEKKTLDEVFKYMIETVKFK